MKYNSALEKKIFCNLGGLRRHYAKWNESVTEELHEFSHESSRIVKHIEADNRVVATMGQERSVSFKDLLYNIVSKVNNILLCIKNFPKSYY
jgi:hypothetical protein